MEKPHLTPRVEFIAPTLQAIVDLGGKARAAAGLVRVEQKMRHRLTPVDYKIATNVRWMNNVHLSVHQMKREKPPLLDPTAAYGWWVVTDDGRRYLER